MTVFVDASALVAFIAGEPERADIAADVASDPDPLWSAMTSWESVVALRNSYDLTLEDARDEVEQTAAFMELRLVGIERDELRFALDAYQLYGKGRHRPSSIWVIALPTPAQRQTALVCSIRVTISLTPT